VPPGHAVALTDAHGQKEPGGHATGAPEAQKKEAGQGEKVSVRRLLAPSSLMTMTPARVTATPWGIANDAAVP
jgi:hypothetical protein